MSDASGYCRQNTHTAKLRETQTAPIDWPACPWWCKEHEETDAVRGVGHGFRLHKGVELSSNVASARLTRADMLGEGVGDVTVLLDDRDLTPEEARVLSTMLAVLVNDSARSAAGQ